MKWPPPNSMSGRPYSEYTPFDEALGDHVSIEDGRSPFYDWPDGRMRGEDGIGWFEVPMAPPVALRPVPVSQLEVGDTGLEWLNAIWEERRLRDLKWKADRYRKNKEEGRDE